MYVPGNDRIIRVAQNTGTGYTNKVLDDNLGYIYTFILDGSYIFTDKVRIIIDFLCIILQLYLLSYVDTWQFLQW